ncbi:hypothetical protein cypCar_00027957, partial [Cyprinus carpio]
EEYKRLNEALADEGTYNAVAFRYSADYYDPSQPTEEDEASKEAEQQEEESEEPFVAPTGLLIPPDVELPATTKTHAIIERTANIVCKQGAQFEIVLKAKQAGNSQFDFLRFDHYLNPYYKHILRAMKEGRYTPASEGKQDQQQAMNYGYCMLHDGTYCFAPPPLGIDASPYYTSLPTGMMPAPPVSGPPPPPAAAGPVTVSAPASPPLSLSAPAAPPTSSSQPPQTTVAPTVPTAAPPCRSHHPSSSRHPACH